MKRKHIPFIFILPFIITILISCERNSLIEPDDLNTPDTMANPNPGNGGIISIDSNLVQNTSFWIQWSEASDSTTEKKDLQYKIVVSTTNNIRIVEEAESAGGGRQVVKDWTNDLCWTDGSTSWEIVGLTRNTPYYVTVLVKDLEGNKNIYNLATVTTKAYHNVPNVNSINTMAVEGTTIYIGGKFTQINGAAFGAVLHSETAQQTVATTKISGDVYCAVPDGAGGWYIGGKFTYINAIPRNRIARINADGSLHAWYPTGGADNIVRTLAVSNGVVYAGGAFTLFGNLPFYRIAAVDAITGELW